MGNVVAAVSVVVGVAVLRNIVVGRHVGVVAAGVVVAVHLSKVGERILAHIEGPSVGHDVWWIERLIVAVWRTG